MGLGLQAQTENERNNKHTIVSSRRLSFLRMIKIIGALSGIVRLLLRD